MWPYLDIDYNMQVPCHSVSFLDDVFDCHTDCSSCTCLLLSGVARPWHTFDMVFELTVSFLIVCAHFLLQDWLWVQVLESL